MVYGRRRTQADKMRAVPRTPSAPECAVRGGVTAPCQETAIIRNKSIPPIASDAVIIAAPGNTVPPRLRAVQIQHNAEVADGPGHTPDRYLGGR